MLFWFTMAIMKEDETMSSDMKDTGVTLISELYLLLLSHVVTCGLDNRDEYRLSALWLHNGLNRIAFIILENGFGTSASWSPAILLSH